MISLAIWAIGLLIVTGLYKIVLEIRGEIRHQRVPSKEEELSPVRSPRLRSRRNF